MPWPQQYRSVSTLVSIFVSIFRADHSRRESHPRGGVRWTVVVGRILVLLVRAKQRDCLILRRDRVILRHDRPILRRARLILRSDGYGCSAPAPDILQALLNASRRASGPTSQDQRSRSFLKVTRKRASAGTWSTAETGYSQRRMRRRLCRSELGKCAVVRK
eukprot:1110109-Rhodomonas_salina.6